jgi:hypothetical protein
MLFSCLPEQLNPFTEFLTKYTWYSGWDIPGASILTIPDSNGTLRNLYNEHGLFTIESGTLHTVAMYLDTQIRATQSYRKLYKCFENSFHGIIRKLNVA